MPVRKGDGAAQAEILGAVLCRRRDHGNRFADLERIAGHSRAMQHSRRNSFNAVSYRLTVFILRFDPDIDVRVRPIEFLQRSHHGETLLGIEFRGDRVMSPDRHGEEEKPKQRYGKAPGFAFHSGLPRMLELSVRTASHKICHGSYQGVYFRVKTPRLLQGPKLRLYFPRKAHPFS